MKKKCLLTALCLLLLLTASGQGEVFKDEVVFARLSPLGEVQTVVVVNAFEADEQSRVTDYGSYVKAQALSKAEGFEAADGQISFTMQAGRFFYQGEMEAKQLPWQIALSYQLDGKEVAPSELAGASGALRVAIRVTPQPAFLAQTDSMTLQLTLALNADACRDIQADRATMAWAGGLVNLVFVVLPGQAAEYVVTTQVTEFSMPDYQVAGLKMAVDGPMYQAIAAKALAGTPLEGAVGNLMGGFIQSLKGQHPVSFADGRNAVRQVQFVLMGEGIQALPAAPSEDVQEEKHEGVIDRLLNLFR